MVEREKRGWDRKSFHIHSKGEKYSFFEVMTTDWWVVIPLPIRKYQTIAKKPIVSTQERFLARPSLPSKVTRTRSVFDFRVFQTSVRASKFYLHSFLFSNEKNTQKKSRSAKLLVVQKKAKNLFSGGNRFCHFGFGCAQRPLTETGKCCENFLSR